MSVFTNFILCNIIDSSPKDCFFQRFYIFYLTVKMSSESILPMIFLGKYLSVTIIIFPHKSIHIAVNWFLFWVRSMNLELRCIIKNRWDVLCVFKVVMGGSHGSRSTHLITLFSFEEIVRLFYKNALEINFLVHKLLVRIIKCQTFAYQITHEMLCRCGRIFAYFLKFAERLVPSQKLSL